MQPITNPKEQRKPATNQKTPLTHIIKRLFLLK